MNEAFLETGKITVDIIETGETRGKNISLSILRLDKIHPVISGNKLFKLHYFLEDAINSLHKTIITFGGSYSSHLLATACAGKHFELKTIGIVRGERPSQISHTLQNCLQNGMQLEFISRPGYREKEDENFLLSLLQKFGEHTLIPEGGFDGKGVKGAAMITGYFKKEHYTHICCAVGTATTFAGLVTSCVTQQVIGFPVLKDIEDIQRRIEHLLPDPQHTNFLLINNYHLGGYARRTGELMSFMNEFFDQHHIPLDFVYTAKMMYGVDDLIKKNYFLPGSKILCIHTGGLQGNLSLPANELNF